MLRRSMLAAIGFLAALPVRAWASPPTKKTKVVGAVPTEFRPAFVAKKTIAGRTAVLDNARMDLQRPDAWKTRLEGTDAYAMAPQEPGSDGAIFVTHLPATRLQLKAPVGIVMEQVAAKMLERFASYRKGAAKLDWEITDQPMAYRRDDGRAGRMRARATAGNGDVIEGYIGVTIAGQRIYVIVGFWQASLDNEFLPAADTMLSTMTTR